MATAKKMGIVDKMKSAIGGMFSSSPVPAKKVAAKKTATKKVAAKKMAKKPVPAKKAATPKGMAQDRKLIALTEPYEVRDWCKSLGCTEPELAAAVKAVGHSATKVRAYLQKA